MRILIDALGAPALTGGMYLHALEIVHAWSAECPDDEIIVIGDEWIAAEFAADPNVVTRVWSSTGFVRRVFGQLSVTPWLARRRDVDAVVGLSPVVSPLVRRRSVAFVHDWRHIKVREEFGFLRARYRALWLDSAKRVDLVACISRKTLEETAQLTSRTTGLLLVENGRDHPRRWADVSTDASADASVDVSADVVTGTARAVVTFGHHNNKRPDLVVRGFAALTPATREGVRLTILGTRGALSRELVDLADELGVAGEVDVAGFVSDAAYEHAIAGAAVVVLASSDEGFGLPVAEAHYFGIPVVTASDSGLSEIHDGLFEAAPDAASMARALEAALQAGRMSVDPSAVYSWRDAVRIVRDALDALPPRRSRPGRPAGSSPRALR